jgi:hypothetical protein
MKTNERDPRQIAPEVRAKFIERGKPSMILQNMAEQEPPEQILKRLYDLLGHAVLLTIPCGKKAPDKSRWQSISFEQTQSAMYQRGLVEVIKRGGNIGVLLGPASDGLTAIDIDDEQLADQFLELNPHLRETLRSCGRRGFQLWLRCKGDYPNAQAYYNLKDDAGRKYGEWRCGGGRGAQSVIFGLHPDNVQYRIECAQPPLEIEFGLIKWLAPWWPKEREEQQPAEEPIPEWLIPRPVEALSDYLPPQTLTGMLYRGAKLVVGAGPKTHKSWFLGQLCYCVANGLAFLGIPTVTAKALYIYFELFEGECKARFKLFRDTFGEGDLKNIEVIQLRGKNRLLKDSHLAKLPELMIGRGFAIAAFDPIYKLFNARDERLGVDISPVLDTLETISENAQCAIAYAQHYAKGNQALKFAIDRISGTNYFTRDADVILTLTDLTPRDCYGVEIIQRSFAEIPSFGVRFEYPLFVRDDSLDVTDIRQPGKEKKTKSDVQADKIIAVLCATDYDKGGMSHAEIMRATGIAKSSLTRLLSKLIREKKVFKTLLGARERYALTPVFRAQLDRDALEQEENGYDL